MTTTPASSKRDRAPWILAGPLGCLTACFLLALAGVTANFVLGQDRTMALVSKAATSTREPAVVFQPTIPSKTTAPVSLPTTVIATEWPRHAQPAGPADSANPRLFFSDLESGPDTGGQDDLGAFVTIYGEGFGGSRGNSVMTIGDREVAKYVVWAQDNAARKMDMIVVQLGPNVASGNIVVTVNGKASNPLPFTVRPGNIYFVAPNAANANDQNPGAFGTPFKTLYRQQGQVAAGDIVYVKGGTFNTADPRAPGWDCVLCLLPDNDASGAAAPIAYVGYPGDPPVLGAPQPMRRAILLDQAMAYYVIANLHFTNYGGMMEVAGNGHRIVGNSFHDGIASYALGIGGNSAHYQLFGNLMRNNGEPGEKMNGVGLYIQGFGTNDDIDVGWNEIEDQHGSRAIQVYGHADNDRIDNLRIHDNLISGSELNNIVLGGSDGATDVLGTVYVYNNIIVGAGDPGLRVNDPQGTVIIQNNVLYNNGTPGLSGSNAQVYIERAGRGKITLQDNILYAGPNQKYLDIEAAVGAAALNASHNLVHNAGDCPDWDTRCINADPLFVNAAANDFRLQPSSPAIEAGEGTGIGSDYLGIARPQGQAYDIGACEFSAPSAAVNLPTAPTVRAVPTQLPQPALLPSAPPQSQSGAFRWVALGDSLTEGDGKSDNARRYTELVLSRLKTIRPAATLRNIGRSGRTLEQMVAEQLPIALSDDPALVSIWIGANDVIYFNPGEDVTSSATAFEQRLDVAVSQILVRTRARIIVANLHDISLIPAARGWSEAERAARHGMTVAINQAIANVVQRHADRVSLVDMFNFAALREMGCYADDYHPSDDCEPRVADLWWQAMQGALR